MACREATVRSRAAWLVVALSAGGCGARGNEPLPEIRLGGRILEGSESLELDRKRVILDGNVIVRGAARLSMRDCELEIRQAYPQQYRLEVRETASFVLANIDLQPSTTWMNWGYYDAAQVTHAEFPHEAEIWQEVHGSGDLTMTDSGVGLTLLATSTARLRAVGASFVQIEIGLPPSAAPYDLTLPNGQTVSRWSTPASLPYSASVESSEVDSIDFDLSDGVNVIVRDSTNVRFGWVFGVGSAGGVDAIAGIQKRAYNDVTFSAGSGPTASSVRLIASSVSDWWPTAFGNHQLALDDCFLADPRAWADSRVTITRSTMTMFGAYGDARATISNSTITGFVVAQDRAIVDLTSVIFTGPIYRAPSAVVRRDGVPVP